MDSSNTVVRLPIAFAIGSMRDEAISEKTPIRLGLFIILITTALGLVAGSATGIWWWASWSSRIETKLTSIEAILGTINTDHTRSLEKIEGLDRRVTRLETIGSPPLVQIQKDVTELLRQFDLHRAKEVKP